MQVKRLLLLFVLFVLAGQSIYGQQAALINAATNTDASFRGLSVVNDKIAWVSGTKGCVGISIDGGKSWHFQRVAGFQQFDFRTIYAFDDKTAVIANAGSPAWILRTTDGGASWQDVYKDDDTSAFIDGIDFWDGKEGIIYGDPINKKLLLLHTSDCGKTWQPLPEESRPVLSQGEVSFAASGTAIRCYGRDDIAIATGGVVSRLWVSADKGAVWKALSTPILQGESTTGIFSVAITGRHFIIVGGDYKADILQVNHVFLSEDGGYTWVPPFKPTGGYRECVEFLGKSIVIATGPTGTDISHDGGKNWKLLTKEGYHVVRKSRKGNKVILAGAHGKIALLKL